MRRSLVFAMTAVVLASCGGETKQPAPPPQSSAPAPSITSTATTAETPAETPRADYEAAMDWFRTAKGFRFTLTEGSNTVEGSMVRPAIGAERVHFRGRDGEWLGSAKRSGLVWFRNQGGWKKDPATPPYADLVYQRVTLTFDPAKKEESPSALGAESLGGEACEHYRFTNANTGDVHDVWVSRRDGRVARISISGERRTTLTVSPGGVPTDVPNP